MKQTNRNRNAEIIDLKAQVAKEQKETDVMLQALTLKVKDLRKQEDELDKLLGWKYRFANKLNPVTPTDDTYVNKTQTNEKPSAIKKGNEVTTEVQTERNLAPSMDTEVRQALSQAKWEKNLSYMFFVAFLIALGMVLRC